MIQRVVSNVPVEVTTFDFDIEGVADKDLKVNLDSELCFINQPYVKLIHKGLLMNQNNLLLLTRFEEAVKAQLTTDKDSPDAALVELEYQMSKYALTQALIK